MVLGVAMCFAAYEKAHWCLQHLATYPFAASSVIVIYSANMTQTVLHWSKKVWLVATILQSCKHDVSSSVHVHIQIA